MNSYISSSPPVELMDEWNAILDEGQPNSDEAHSFPVGLLLDDDRAASTIEGFAIGSIASQISGIIGALEDYTLRRPTEAQAVRLYFGNGIGFEEIARTLDLPSAQQARSAVSRGVSFLSNPNIIDRYGYNQ